MMLHRRKLSFLFGSLLLPAPLYAADLPESPPFWKYEAHAPTNYRINGDGTVTDTTTGLMWKQCSEGKSGKDCSSGKAIGYGWDDAMEKFGKNVNFAGYNDWRMPTCEELRTLVYCSNGTAQEVAGDYGCDGKDGKDGKDDKVGEYQRPTIDVQAFPGTPEYGWYWSSTEKNASSAWYVHFFNGYDGWGGSRYNTGHVRLVRSGQ